MRIVLDARPLTGPWGGVRRYVVDLIRALSRVDAKNEYALLGPQRDWEDELQVGDRFRGFPSPGEMTRLFDQISLSSVRDPFDLYHGTNYEVPLIAKYPSVITVHDLSVKLFPKTHPLKRRLGHMLLPKLCRRAAGVIADSHHTKRDLVEHFGLSPDKIDVIYLAVGDDLRRVRDAAILDDVRRHYRLPDQFNLFLGTVEPRKNLDVLIEATRILKSEGLEHRLVIAGMPVPAYLRKIQRTIRRAGLVEGEDVMLIGSVEERHLAALYSLCTLFVYPSLYEGFGLPPLEAMACQAPVLVPDNSSLGELYAKSAALFDLSRPDGLVSTMRRVLGSREVQSELAEQGLKLNQTRNWDSVARETMDVYERAYVNH